MMKRDDASNRAAAGADKPAVIGGRPRLVFFSSCLPDPLGTGTEQRAYSFLSAYAKWMDVELWFHARSDNPECLRLSRVAPLCSAAFSFHPKLLREGDEPTMTRLIRSVRANDYVHVTQLMILTNHPAVFWDIDELPWLVGDPERRRILRKDRAEPAELVWEQSKQFAKTCSLIFASSARERHNDLGKIHVIPNCYQAGNVVQPRASSSTLLFVGTMGYEPNADAVRYFVNAILPLLPERIRFRFVGRRPSGRDYAPLIRSLSRNPRVDVFFDVDSCAPHYAAAAAAIVPLRFGSGTRLKILEAFSYGCPVVSTSKGSEGLEVRNDAELLIADDPAEFAAACERLLSSREMQERLSRTALAFVTNNHSQDVVERKLLACLSEIGVFGSESISRHASVRNASFPVS
jgi:glycosyltransferase involved in cell wall biosynthesis